MQKRAAEKKSDLSIKGVPFKGLVEDLFKVPLAEKKKRSTKTNHLHKPKPERGAN